MASNRMRAGKRQESLSWGLVSFLAVYFLSLCTLSPLVHADLLHQAVQAHPTSAGHCSFPPSAPKTENPPSTDQQRTTVPVCCKLMATHNKATSASLVQTNASPLLFLTLLPSRSGTFAWRMNQLHFVRALHSSHSPPLYLLLTVLRI